MNVFVIPAWHPTMQKPHWCNWIKPHINIARNIAERVVILQVDQEVEINSNKIISLGSNHYYIHAGYSKTKYSRTALFYNRILNEYILKLESLYQHAVEIHGKPDIIHAHVAMPAGYGAGVLGNKYNIPVIVTEHYSGFFSDNKYPWRLTRFYREMRKNIDGLYTVSPGFRDKIQNKTNIVVDGVLPNPVDTSLFYQEQNFQRSKPLKLVSTGTVGLIKGTDILLKALTAIPESIKWQLTIIGNTKVAKDAFWKKLISQIPKEKLTFVEPVSQDELRKIYSRQDVYIVSSRVETANVSMLEAMACGCYLITSRINAPETLVSEEVANIFDNTPEALAKCIQDVSQQKLPNRSVLRQFVLDNYSYKTLQKKLKLTYESHINNSCR